MIRKFASKVKWQLIVVGICFVSSLAAGSNANAAISCEIKVTPGPPYFPNTTVTVEVVASSTSPNEILSTRIITGTVGGGGNVNFHDGPSYSFTFPPFFVSGTSFAIGQCAGTVSNGQTSSTAFFTMSQPPPPTPDTQNSCLIAANSTINPDTGALGETIGIVGAPFSLNHTSDHYRGGVNFDPKTLGFGGWTASIVHHYDAAKSILYTGDSLIRNITAQPYPGGGVYATNTSGSEIYVFDSNGRHLQTINALTGAAIYNFSYDSIGRLNSILDSFGNSTQIAHAESAASIASPYGQVTNLAFDAQGFLSSVTNPNGETHQMTYSLGLITSYRLPAGQLSHVTYSDGLRFLTKDTGAGGNFIALMQSIDPSSSTQTVVSGTALNRQTTYTLNSPTPQRANRSVLAPDGSFSTSSIDSQGTSQIADAFGGTFASVKTQDPRFGWLSPFAEQSSYVLPGVINLQTTTQKNATLSNASDPLSLISLSTQTTIQGDRTYSTNYTAATRILLRQSPQGRTMATTLNNQGQLISVQRGNLTKINMAYDERGRLSQVTQGNRSLQLGYDSLGNLAKSRDSLGRTTRYEYDLAGRVIRQIAPSGQTIAMTYDANGNLTSLTPPGRSAHSFGYNLFELLENYVPPGLGAAMSGAMVYSYNLDMQLTKVSRSDGKEMEYHYNSRTGLLESITSSDGNYSLQYYPSSSLVQTLASPDGVNLSYEYFGKLPKSITSSGQVASTLDFTYQTDGALASIGVNGSTISLLYDKDGLLKQVGNINYSRDDVGGITQSSLRGTEENLKYDNFGQVIKRKFTKGKKTLLSEEIERDKLGRITRIDGDQDKRFEYDSAGRLITARVGHKIRKYKYDQNGNRLWVDDGRKKTKAEYDAQDRLIVYGDGKYEYTENGELKAKIIEEDRHGHRWWNLWHKWKGREKRTDYDYDVFGNLQKVTLPDGKVVEYVIDGQNRRVGKKVNGELTASYVYQSQTQIAAELNAQGAITKRFIYGSKPNVPDYMVMNGKEYRIVSDQAGTPQMVVEAVTGKILEAYEYDEFGRLLDGPKHPMLPFGFAGGLADRDTNLVRFGARDYDPETGRWTSKDPIGFAGGDSNLYGYVLQDPINVIDPSGLASSSASEGAGHGYGTGPVITLSIGATFNLGGMLGNTNGISVGYSTGVGYDLTTGVLLPFTTTGCGDEASGAYAGAGLGIGYAPTVGQLYGLSTSTNFGAGLGESVDFNFGSAGFGTGAPVLGVGIGAGGGVQKTNTNFGVFR